MLTESVCVHSLSWPGKILYKKTFQNGHTKRNDLFSNIAKQMKKILRIITFFVHVCFSEQERISRKKSWTVFIQLYIKKREPVGLEKIVQRIRYCFTKLNLRVYVYVLFSFLKRSIILMAFIYCCPNKWDYTHWKMFWRSAFNRYLKRTLKLCILLPRSN